MSYAKLDSGIIFSSVWSQPEYVRTVWTTILALKDQNGFVGSSYSGLRRAANLTEDPTGEKFDAAIKCLESPDDESRTKDFEGRRIEKVDGGWIVLNHGKYRGLLSSNPDAVRQRNHRSKQSEQTELTEKVATVCDMSQNAVTPVSVSVFESVPENTQENAELPFFSGKQGPDSVAGANIIYTPKNSPTVIPPDLDDVRVFIKQTGCKVNAVTWFNHYKSTGWMIGDNKMADWQASIYSWHERVPRETTGNSGVGRTGALEQIRRLEREKARELEEEMESAV